LKALVGDLAQSGKISAVELESFGFLGFNHGYHHEMSGISLGLVEQSLLSLCFCAACKNRARVRGIDGDSLSLQIRQRIDAGINDPSIQDRAGSDALEEIQNILQSMGGLREFIECRCTVVTDLIKQIAENVHAQGLELYCDAPVFMRAPTMEWVGGFDVGALSELVDGYEVDLCWGSPKQNAEEAMRVGKLRRSCRMGATINVGHPTSQSREDVLAHVQVAKDVGFDNVGFYNYGMLPEYRLAWIREAAFEWQRSRGNSSL
jgi:hypothetical protein